MHWLNASIPWGSVSAFHAYKFQDNSCPFGRDRGSQALSKHWNTFVSTFKFPCISSSILRMTAFSCNYGSNSSWHAFYKSLAYSRGYLVPFGLDPVPQFPLPSWGLLVTPQLPFQVGPEVLDWIQVRALGRPVQYIYLR